MQLLFCCSKLFIVSLQLLKLSLSGFGLLQLTLLDRKSVGT